MARERGAWTKAMWAGAGVSALAVGVLSGYVLFSGDDDGRDTAGAGKGSASASAPSASPVPSYTVPEDWTEPERWAALPRGERTDKYGSQVKFPRTTEGAVAALMHASTTVVEGAQTAVDEQLRVYHSYVGAQGQSEANAEQVELSALQTHKNLSKKVGLTPEQIWPTGYHVRNSVVGYQMLGKPADDEVSVWLLSRVTVKAGETATEASAYTRTAVGAQWTDGDWKITPAAAQHAAAAMKSGERPGLGVPGDLAFNREGWTAIREAS
ncbi:hypothetical protein [Streptomyces sp. NPDC047097]|uniref:hypothetical protein n=1 Tax=Streptomyces sp. NPDC047097 TaxID=3155260 RepID=UPI00340B459D